MSKYKATSSAIAIVNTKTPSFVLYVFIMVSGISDNN
jgi:hypothetical protein